jgi:hypothetical protein
VVKKASLLLIPVLFSILGLTFGSRQFHWDTLERATLMESPAAYLQSWDGSPRSQFLSFAHILELPLASLLRVAMGFPSGMRTLIVFEILCGVAVLLLVAHLARLRGASLATTIVVQAALASSWGFWKMATSGEERILGLLTALLFLVAYWHHLRSGRYTVAVALTLAFAILCHLSNAVLVPFGLLGLVLLTGRERPHRRSATAALVAGGLLAAVCYVVVAAWTTGVRTPVQFWNYLTFFHRDTGNDFFTPGAIGDSLLRATHGMRHFFAPAWGGVATLVMLLLAIAWGARRRRGRGVSLQARHLLLLVALWSLHFVFFEPTNVESWTLPATALLLGAAWSLPATRHAVGLGGVVLVLVISNAASFRELHRPMSLQRYHDAVVAASAPDDIILMGGGIQNGRPLRGSLATRYFLAFEKDRTIVSLYDVLHITQAEFWGRPIASAQQLQAEIERGRRVWFPAFLETEFEAAQKSGLVQLQVQAHGDSLFEVTSVRVPRR